MYPEVQLVIER